VKFGTDVQHLCQIISLLTFERFKVKVQGQNRCSEILLIIVARPGFNAQYTPPTRRNCRVASRRRCEHNSQLARDDCRRIRSTIWKLARLHSGLTTRILIDIDNFCNNDDIMTSLLKKLSISIKIRVIKRYGVCLVSFQIVDRIRRQSS